MLKLPPKCVHNLYTKAFLRPRHSAADDWVTECPSAAVGAGEQPHFILQSRFSIRSRRRSGGWRDRVNGEDWRWSKINKSSCTSSSTSSSTSRSRSRSSGVMWWWCCCWLNWCCWVLVGGRQRNVITRSVDGIHLSHAVLWGSISRENTLSLDGRWDAGDFFLRAGWRL